MLWHFVGLTMALRQVALNYVPETAADVVDVTPVLHVVTGFQPRLKRA